MLEPDSVWGLVGLFGGLGLGFLGFLYGRARAAKNRGLDERYYEVVKRAKSSSWWITFVAVVIIFVAVLLRLLTSPAEVIGLVYLVLIASYSISLVYYQLKI